MQQKMVWINLICVGWAFCIVLGVSTANIVPILFGVIFGMLCSKRVEQCSKTEKNVSIMLSVFFSVAMVLGNIERIIGFDGALLNLISLAFCIYGFFSVFDYIIQNLLYYIRKDAFVCEKINRIAKEGRILYLVSFVVLILVWGIGLLVSYPGNTTRDSRWIINQAVWLEQMEVANPPIHTLLVRAVWNMGQFLGGDANFSLALCCIVQIVGATLVISYCLYRLYMWGIKKWICILALAFYAFIPYNVQLMHTLWKDIPFAILTLLFMLLLWEAYEIVSKTDTISIGRCTALLMVGVLMCLMRNNGYYAFVFFIPFGVFLFWKKGKKVVLVLCGVLMLTKVIQGPVYDRILSWNETSRQAMLQEDNVPDDKRVEQEAIVVENATSNSNAVGIYIVTIQQLARVVVDRTNLPIEEVEELNQLFDVEYMRIQYNPYCSDDALRIVSWSLSTKEYLSLWIKYGIKYPYSYIVAWRDSTYGYWYPDIQNWIYSDAIKENDIGVYKAPLVPENIREKISKLEEIYLDIPILGLLWSIGFIVWLTFIGWGICIVRRGVKYGLLYVPLLGIWATLLLASPVYAEFRYIYSFFLCLPLSLLMPFAESRTNE